MLKRGILNPGINSLLSRVRHTNTLVIADRGLPSWPGLETIDISLVDDLPRVLDVVRAVKGNFNFGKAYMAEEFFTSNTAEVIRCFEDALAPVAISREVHSRLKERVPVATGLIRTGDTIQYANVILESA